MNNLKSLVLNVNKRWFEEVKAGTKHKEYRVFNDYWKKRLLHADGTPKQFKDIQYKLGYPKSGDTSKTLTFAWRGFDIETIIHPHFNNEPVKVFGIHLVREEGIGQ
ncbi:ASCH domain-containing protein [Vibrio alginolyticus]|nr:ASCH domain-containing protein [Vibrio alginolyticus]